MAFLISPGGVVSLCVAVGRKKIAQKKIQPVHGGYRSGEGCGQPLRSEKGDGVGQASQENMKEANEKKLLSGGKIIPYCRFVSFQSS